jgi:hypothetical protein
MGKNRMSKYSLTIVILLFLVSGCTHQDTDVIEDAGCDIDLIDVEDIVDVEDIKDVEDVEDTDVPDYEDPFEVEVSCGRNVDDIGYLIAAGGKYPYLYYVTYKYEGETPYFYFYSFNVETQEKQFIDNIPRFAIGGLMSLATGDNALYWMSAYVYKQPEGSFPPTYYDNRLFRFDIETHNVEDITTQYPWIVSPRCEENYGLNRLIQINFETNRALIECIYRLEEAVEGQDIYSVQLDTGEYEYLAYGEDGKIFSAKTWEEINPDYISLTETAWIEEWDYSKDSTMSYNVFSFENNQYNLVENNVYEPWTMGTLPNIIGSDNMYYQVRLYGDEKLQVYGKDIETEEEIAAPETEVSKSNPAQLGKDFPHLVAYNTGPSVRFSSDHPMLFPKYVNQLNIWDKAQNIERQVTVIPSQFTNSTFLPFAPEARYLIYILQYSNVKCLYYKDLFAAGMIDNQSNLIPEN